MMEPVVSEVTVPAGTAEAFRRFTAELVTWWPVTTHSVSRERCARVAIEPHVGGRLLETEEDGTEHEWGRVQIWDEPHRFAVTWHPGRTAELAQRVEVVFEAADGGTRVRLTHSGWEILGDEADRIRANYAGGWSGVMAIYAESFGGGA